MKSDTKRRKKKYTYLSSCYEVYLNTRKGGKGQTTGRKLSYSAEHDATGRQAGRQAAFRSVTVFVSAAAGSIVDLN
jgi:hypothetical protein